MVTQARLLTFPALLHQRRAANKKKLGTRLRPAAFALHAFVCPFSWQLCFPGRQTAWCLSRPCPPPPLPSTHPLYPPPLLSFPFLPADQCKTALRDLEAEAAQHAIDLPTALAVLQAMEAEDDLKLSPQVRPMVVYAASSCADAGQLAVVRCGRPALP